MKNSKNVAALEVRSLFKSFRCDGQEVSVLKDINCKIMPGEIVGIVGASGVGKTTFLHILGTLDRPSSGEVKHFGKNVFLWSDNKLSKFRNKEIGFVFQFHYLLPEFSTLENVMMPCLISGSKKEIAYERASKILEELGLKNKFNMPVNQLSGGEQQRVALARALVQSPKIVLADEPTGNLDETSGEKVIELMLDLNKKYHTTLIIVTHNLSLAKKMDRCLGLTHGKIVELSTDELKDFGVGAWKN